MADSNGIPANAPVSCPGPSASNAGKLEGCAGCPNQKLCSTGEFMSDVSPAEVKKQLVGVKNKILVLSGKGGVGKSTVTAEIARGLAKLDFSVGVLDIDVCGPSLSRIMGVNGETVHKSSSGWSPVYTLDDIAVMSIDFLLSSEEDAVIWRGAKKNGMIKEFLCSVDWGDLDCLIIDTPPGTSDEHLAIVSLFKQSKVNGAVLVTTPQEVSLSDVRKEISFCRKLKIPMIGLVENMSSYTCSKCQTKSQIFPATSGGGTALAASENIPLLCSLPLDPFVGRSGDNGLSVLSEAPAAKISAGYRSIVEQIIEFCNLK
ncbi:cytosolic Fe-S cluster assembly factor nubp1-like [Bolinopsis microptera]|uniref:cytosolic Fe-S cluster assembly factor nubp1-like n=1 Tax=Bolinopsis microptera TaxID=2820187 RepID=UPI003078B229